MVETFFMTLKAELVWRTVFQSRAEADLSIGRYIASTILFAATPQSTSSVRSILKTLSRNRQNALH
jgi:hypothetical protein